MRRQEKVLAWTRVAAMGLDSSRQCGGTWLASVNEGGRGVADSTGCPDWTVGYPWYWLWEDVRRKKALVKNEAKFHFCGIWVHPEYTANNVAKSITPCSRIP